MHDPVVIADRSPLLAGDPGIDQTLRAMRRLVLESSSDADVIGWAQGVVRNLPERNPDVAAQAFLGWVRSNVRYTEDPLDAEVVKTPEAMIKEFNRFGKITGDCDDQVVLLSSGLNAVGVPTEFIVVAADPNYPNDYSHVLMQYQSQSGDMVTMDPIMRGSGPGWFPSRASRIGVYRNGRINGSARAGNVGSKFALLIVGYILFRSMKKSRSR